MESAHTSSIVSLNIPLFVPIGGTGGESRENYSRREAEENSNPYFIFLYNQLLGDQIYVCMYYLLRCKHPSVMINV